MASPRAEPWITPWLGDVERREVRIATVGESLDADVYTRSGRPPRAALVLVHGLSAMGRRQPDLVRLARVLAAGGPLVIVPHFPGLAVFRLGGREVDEIRLALRHARAMVPAVGVAGFSFGAGPALIAAAAEGVEIAASFGGYADLRNVIVFIATGVHEFSGQRFHETPEPYNRWKLAALLAPFTSDAADRERLAAIVATRLADPSADTRSGEATLGAAGRAVLALVRATDESEVRHRLDELPEPTRAALDALSPAAAVGRLGATLLIAHGASDPSIPFTESQRLAGASGGARAVILGGFDHTGATDLVSAAAVGGRLVRVVDAILRFP